MPFVELVSERDVPLVPTLPVVGLVTADEHDCSLIGIEREQCPEVTADRPQLLHVVMARPADRVNALATKARTVLPQMIDRRRNPIGVSRPQAPDPLLRFRRELDLPRTSARHVDTIASPPVTEQDTFVSALPISAGAAARWSRNGRSGGARVHNSPRPGPFADLGDISVSEALMRTEPDRSRRFGEFCAVGASPAGVGLVVQRASRRVPSTEPPRPGSRFPCRRPIRDRPGSRRCCLA